MTLGKVWVSRKLEWAKELRASIWAIRTSSWWTWRGFPLGHVEASANLNEKLLVEPLLDRVLGEDLEVELAVGDSQLESPRCSRC